MATLKKKTNKSVFAVTCNQTSQQLLSSKFFSSRAAARKHLKKLAGERRYNLGVDCWQQDDDGFSFIFGWEEVKVAFRIVEVPIEE